MNSRVALPENVVLDNSYRIQRMVGYGGFGVTYEAADLNLGTQVAIKEYYPAQFGERDHSMSVRPRSEKDSRAFEWGRTSFLQEARTLARFTHPSIVRVLRVFEANSTAYMVMRYEDGQSFGRWLDALGRPPAQEELDAIAAPLLDALEVMHATNYLHRDIAPDNIIVRDDGTPVLLDFGAARRAVAEMSRTLTGIVKAGYSPHEQYSADSRLQGPWTDLYALGGTFYRAIAGAAPEEATLRIDDDRMQSAADAGKGRYRPGFLAAIDACLKIRPSQRPQSVGQLRAVMFGTAAQTAPQVARTVAYSAPSPQPKAAAAARASAPRRWPAVAALAILAVLGGTYAGTHYTRLQSGEALPGMRIATADIDGLSASRAREEAAAQEQRQLEQRAAEEARRKAEAEAEAARRTAEAERLRTEAEEQQHRALAAVPDPEQRIQLVRRVQAILQSRSCYKGPAEGKIEEVQKSLDQFVEAAARKGPRLARLDLARATVGDYQGWFREAEPIGGEICSPQPAAAILPPRPAQPVRPKPVAQPVQPRPAPQAEAAPGKEGHGRCHGWVCRAIRSQKQ